MVRDAGGSHHPAHGQTIDWTWWLRIGYLSSADSAGHHQAGDTVIEAEVKRRAHDLYVKVNGSFDERARSTASTRVS